MEEKKCLMGMADAWRRGSEAVVAVKGGPFKRSERYRIKQAAGDLVSEVRGKKEAHSRKAHSKRARKQNRTTGDNTVVELTEAGEALAHMERTLKLLVAAGIVTEEQVEIAQKLEASSWRKKVTR